MIFLKLYKFIVTLSFRGGGSRHKKSKKISIENDKPWKKDMDKRNVPYQRVQETKKEQTKPK